MAKKTKVSWDPSKSALRNARSVLPGLAAEYLEASRKLPAGKRSTQALHKFRLQTKTFRYTLELFRSCCGPGLGARVEALRRIQQDLGEINDCATARRLMSGRKGLRSRQFAEFLQFLDARTVENTAGLFQQVQHILHASGKQRWWTDGLARVGGRARGRSSLPPGSHRPPATPTGSPPSRAQM